MNLYEFDYLQSEPVYSIIYIVERERELYIEELYVTNEYAKIKRSKNKALNETNNMK